jgi:hypothetical protein
MVPWTVFALKSANNVKSAEEFALNAFPLLLWPEVELSILPKYFAVPVGMIEVTGNAANSALEREVVLDDPHPARPRPTITIVAVIRIFTSLP